MYILWFGKCIVTHCHRLSLNLSLSLNRMEIEFFCVEQTIHLFCIVLFLVNNKAKFSIHVGISNVARVYAICWIADGTKNGALDLIDDDSTKKVWIGCCLLLNHCNDDESSIQFNCIHSVCSVTGCQKIAFFSVKRKWMFQGWFPWNGPFYASVYQEKCHFCWDKLECLSVVNGLMELCHFFC